VKAIVGRPTAGLRLSLEKAREDAEAVTYRGTVHLPHADVPAEVAVALPGGAVTVTLGEGGTPALEKTASALVRAATKAPVAGGASLPRKIVRWRG
jgi:hypothetical protein